MEQPEGNAPNPGADLPFTFGEIEFQVRAGMDMITDAYLQKSLGGLKIFLLTTTVTTILSDLRDGLILGLVAWGVSALWYRWIWNKALEAYGQFVTENAKQAGMESFDFLNATHAKQGRKFLATLYHTYRRP